MDERGYRERVRIWWSAARIHTLPAGIAPVLVGIGIAWSNDIFALLPALAALLGALLIQIGTNFANDYYDAVHGVDTPEREGFTRATAAGLIDPTTMRDAMILTFVAAIALGTYLVYVGGVPILVIGLLSVAAGIAYTGGPLPFGYRGLGDVFVFVFFGIIAVVGTYYVQAVSALEPLPRTIPPGTIAIDAVVASLAMGALTTAILVINNVRDLEEDAAAGKRTLAVIIGRRWSRVEFVGLLILAYLVPVWFLLETDQLPILVVYATLPMAWRVARVVLRETSGTALNPALSSMGRLTLVYAISFVVGVVV